MASVTDGDTFEVTLTLSNAMVDDLMNVLEMWVEENDCQTEMCQTCENVLVQLQES